MFSSKRKIGINRGIDQPIRQIIRMNALPRGAFLQSQTRSDQIERVARPLLKRHQKILAQKQAELFADMLVRLIGNPHHDEQAVLVRIDLRPLMDVDNIFERQRVHLKHFGDRLAACLRSQARRHRPTRRATFPRIPSASRRVFNLLLDDSVLVVRHDANGRRLRIRLE